MTASSATIGRALTSSVEVPEGVTAESLALGVRSLGNIPSAPRLPTPRMRVEQLSLFRGNRGILTTTAALCALLATLALFGRGLAFALPTAGIGGLLVLGSVWMRTLNARLIEHGLPTLGRVDGVRIHEVKGAGNGTDQAFVSYTFSVRGEERTGSARVEIADAKEIGRAGVVPLVYDPAKPKRSLLWLGALDVR